MASPPPPPPPQRTGLYASLLGDTPAAPSATISAPPVVFSQQQQQQQQQQQSTPSGTGITPAAKVSSSALRFQPLIAKKRPGAAPAPKPKPIPAGTAKAGEAKAPVPAKTTLEDWVGGEEEVAYERPARPKGKRRRKNRATPPPPTNWDDAYDPQRPNSYDEYRDGDERLREAEEWRGLLYGGWSGSSGDNSSSSSDGAADSSDERPRPRGFAPPPGYNFAPPPPPPPPARPDDAADTRAPVPVPDDASGEDAFARRMRMSQLGAAGYSETHTIAAEPVRYSGRPEEEAAAAAAAVSAKHGFAQRLMAAQGWKAGSGLGKDGKGITSAIQLNRTKKGTGVFVDRNRKAGPREPEGVSEVVVLRGCVDGAPAEMDDGEVVQSVGDKYKRFGRIEQIVLRWDAPAEASAGERTRSGRVFVCFADKGSAQMVVRGLQRVEVFEGNSTTAEFWSRERFEDRDFEE